MRSDQIKITLCFLAMLLLPVLCFADNTGMGNNYYAKGQYKEAAASYQKLVNEGYQSAEVYYNLGNAYYKLGNIASAILYYEKARLLSPGDDDINFNIRLANSKITDKVDEAPEFFISKWWNEFILSFSVNALGIASILFVLLGSAALILYFFAFSVSRKKASFYTSILLFILGAAAIVIAFSQTHYFDNHKQAIIFTSTVNIKSGPNDKLATLFVLHEGTKVNVLDANNGWVKFKLGNGNEGWIKLVDIKEI
jgi:tetratricopeptide (TPR) repeat protein